MHRIRVHEKIDGSERAESVRDALERDVPGIESSLEYVNYLHALQQSLVGVLSSSTSVLGASTINRARVVHHALIGTMLEHAETMSDANVAQESAGWNMLMLTWCVSMQLDTAVARARATLSDNTEQRPLDETSLVRNELLRWSGGTSAVARYSMLELIAAIDVLRTRLNMLDTIDGAIVRYILMLERRTAAFVTRTVTDKRDYNAPVWLRDSYEVTLGFVAATAWWFVWTKRYVTWYLSMSRPRFYATELADGCVRRIDASIDLIGRASIIAFVERYALSMNTDDHEREFVRMVSEYTVAPGDLDEHTYVHGMNGVERATVQDVNGRRNTPEATTYIALHQFKRPLINWVRSMMTRARLVGRGRFVGGGVACEAFYEQLAVLHIVHAMFVARLGVPFARWFIVTVRGVGARFEHTVHRAISLGRPFIVQRAGRFACVVPAPTNERATSVDVVEALLGLPTCDGRAACAAATLYDGTDVFDALTVWARFMIECWNGRLEQSARLRLRPLLERMFAERPSSALMASEGARQRTDLASSVSARRSTWNQV